MKIKKFKDYINKKVDEIDAYFHPKTYRVKNFIENQSVSDIREVLYNFTDEFTTISISYCLYTDGRFLTLHENKMLDRFCDSIDSDNDIFKLVKKYSNQNKKIEFQIKLDLNDDRFNDTNKCMQNYELEEFLSECGEQIKDMCYFNSFRYSPERNSWGRPVCKLIFTF